MGPSAVRRFPFAAGLLLIAGCALFRGAAPAAPTAPPDAGPADSGAGEADGGAPLAGVA